MRAATFNVLADAYLSYGDYTHVDPQLLLPHARTEGIVQLVDDLEVDVIGIQEADKYLRDAFKATANWQVLWSQKEGGKPDGCLTLVKPDVAISDFDTYPYKDGSGHIFQAVRIGRAVFANTHIKWAPDDSIDHVGVAQTNELLKRLEDEQSALIFADCNDRPNGPVRKLIENAGFVNIGEDEPTAIVNKMTVALDLLAVRGIAARRIARSYDLQNMPSRDCPSDHIPIVAEIENI